MPYIVQVGPDGFDTHYHRSHAVATLDEAREALKDAVRVGYPAEWSAAKYGDQHIARNLPESGGTIGPLPDGTVIEVRHIVARDLAALLTTTPGAGHTIPALIAAYNAR